MRDCRDFHPTLRHSLTHSLCSVDINMLCTHTQCHHRCARAHNVITGMYADYKRFLSPHVSGMLLNGMAGAMSGLTEGVLIPLERVQALMQSPQYHDHLPTSRAAAVECLRVGGVRELYRGVSPVLLRNGLSSGAFFAFRHPVAKQVSQSASFNMYCGPTLSRVSITS